MSPRVTTVCIDGDSGRTYRKCIVYPEDYAESEAAQYVTDLKDRNFRLPIGEELYWRGNPYNPLEDDEVDGRFIHYGRVQFSQNGPVYVLPVEQWSYRNRLKIRVDENDAFIPDYRVNSYDTNLNPAEVQTAGNPVTSYIWGYL